MAPFGLLGGALMLAILGRVTLAKATSAAARNAASGATNA